MWIGVEGYDDGPAPGQYYTKQGLQEFVWHFRKNLHRYSLVIHQ